MDNSNLRMRLMLEAEKELTENLTEVQRYQYYLGRMQFLHYVSGKEKRINEIKTRNDIKTQYLLKSFSFFK